MGDGIRPLGISLDPPLGVRLQSTAQIIRTGEWRLSLLHDSQDYTLIWITRGQSIAFLDGLRRGVGANTLLFVPVGHLLSVDLGRNGGGSVLRIPRDLAQQMALPDIPRALKLNMVAEQAVLTGYFEAIAKEQAEDQPFAQEAVAAQTQLLSVYLRRQLAKLPVPPAAKASHRLMRRFSQKVSVHFAEGLPMADYAKMLGVTPTHLTRACKAASGMTAAEILANRSLYAARDLIETTARPLKDIGQDLGFGSAAYFSRFVQNHTGQPPSSLRRQAQTRELSVVR